MLEPGIGGYTPPAPFGLYSDGLVPHEILRILLGTVNVLDRDLDKQFSINQNELRNGNLRKAAPTKVLEKVFSESVSEREYESVLRRINLANRDYFERIRNELLCCIVAKKQGRYVESFLYLYRLIERVSVAAPLLYATIEDDFRGSRDFFLTLVRDEKQGELKILERFLQKLSAHSQLSDVSFELDFSILPTSYLSETRRQIEINVLSEIDEDQYENEPEREVISVKFRSMSRFLVTLRNRMFHYSVNGKNIDLSLIGGAEHISRISVSEGIYWFSMLYAQLISRIAANKI